MSHEIRPVHITDADYPQRMKDRPGLYYPEWSRSIPGAPSVVYVVGKVDNEAAVMSAIGSRRIKETDQRSADTFLRKFFTNFQQRYHRRSLVVVSGMATGGDSVAHLAALDEKVPTMAILPTPINVPHPDTKQAHWIYQRIAESNQLGTALLSEYAAVEPGETATPRYYDRDRLIAWAGGILLVYGIYEKKSGAMYTAGLAFHSQVPIFFLPETVSRSVATELTNQFGAIPVHEPDDIFMALKPRADE